MLVVSLFEVLNLVIIGCVYSIILLFIYIINYLSIKTIHDLLIS
jgi:hypothetical protein